MARLNFTTMQANHGMQGNYSAGIAVPGIGVGIYVGSAGDVELVTKSGDTVLYSAVPQGSFMQVPLFESLTSNTTSTDLSIAYISPPWL